MITFFHRLNIRLSYYMFARFFTFASLNLIKMSDLFRTAVANLINVLTKIAKPKPKLYWNYLKEWRHITQSFVNRLSN